MSLPRHLALSPDVISQEVSGEMVLLDLNSEHYFGLDAVGARTWQLLGQSGDLEVVVEALLQEFDVEEVRLRGDLARLLGELLEAGLVSSAPAGGEEPAPAR